MPTFEYTALGQDGHKENGVVTSDTARAARKELRLRSLTPVSLDEVNEARGASGQGRTPKLKISARVLATRQLAIMVGSGMQLEQTLGAIASQTEEPVARRVFAGIRDKVSQGYKFSEALRDYPRSFSPLYQAATAAGELSGELATVLASLADHLEKTQKTRRKVLTALIYPIVLSVVALFVIGLLMVLVVPRIVDQFADFDQALPLLTQIVIWLSNGLKTYGIVMAGALMLAIVGIGRLMAKPHIKRRVDGAVLKLPVIGKLVRTVNAAQFARTFAMLVGSGTPVVDSMAAAKGALGNLVFVEAVEAAIIAVKEGASPARALTGTGVFPHMLTGLIARGTASDNLAGLMEKGATYLEDDFDSAIGLVIGLFEPFIILVLGTIVALIVLSIMLPIMQLNTLAFS